MRVLVTGGGGFLGKKIVEQLLERGDEVTTLARGDYPELARMGARPLRGDIADPASCQEAVAGQDAVIHTAARVGIWGPHEDFVRVNVTGTQNLLEASRDAGVRAFVFTSSPSVTSDGGDVEGAAEKPYPASYLASYPETKAASERMALEFHDPDGMGTTALRPHLIWGPGDPNLIPRLLDRARKGRLRIVGDGKNRVDITYIDNAAQAHLQALDALLQRDEPGPGGKAYFISNDEPVDLWPWINGLLARLQMPPVTRKVPASVATTVGGFLEGAWRTFRLGGEPPLTRFSANQLATSHWYDMGPARRDFGYEPKISMAEGMEHLIASFQDERGGA